MAMDGMAADRRAQGTQKRTQQQLELEIENMGGHLNAYTSVRAGNPRRNYEHGY
jgi:hypothetical protein